MRTFVTDRQTDRLTDGAGFIGPEGGSKKIIKIGQNFQFFSIVFLRVKTVYKTSILPCLIFVFSRNIILEKIRKFCNLEKHTKSFYRPLKLEIRMDKLESSWGGNGLDRGCW